MYMLLNFIVPLTSGASQTFYKRYEEGSVTKLDVNYRSLDSLRMHFTEIRKTSTRTCISTGQRMGPMGNLYTEWNPTKVLDTVAPK